MNRRTAAVLALAGITALTSGCSGSSKPSASSSASPFSATSVQSFYQQKLHWTSCDEGECATLRVPIDYAKPSGPTISLAVNRRAATGERQGSLVVNPGGPGASGVDYASHADQIVGGSIRKHFDVVGFDPRGVQRSAGITCVDDATLDDMLGSDPSPDTKAEEADVITADKKFGADCQKNAGPLLGHVSTVEAAKDMDVLRAALGEKQLNYLGKSYGTFLGSTYADLFPKNVGRMVLDGVVPPDLSMKEINEGQAKGFERALDAYLASCTTQKDCPLGSDAAAGKTKLQEWLRSLDTKMVRVSGDSRLDRLTEGWAINGIADALYDKNSWGSLTTALRSAMAGDGSALLNLGRTYAGRNDDGTYSSNIMQAIGAINCLDRPAPTGGQAEYEKDAEAFRKVAPTWGTQLAWAGASCAEWPIKATGSPHKISAAGSNPIVVVGTTRDPATLYEWSESLASQLQNGRLVTRDGDGHTGYGRGNACVDDAVENYLVDGKAPARTTSC